MFRLDVLQDQWLILALGGGLVFILFLALAYLGYWRTPPDEAEAHRPVPWLLILVYAAIPVFAIVYLVLRATQPPNW